MENQNRQNRLDLLRAANRRFDQPRYEVGGTFFDEKGLLQLIDKIAAAKLPAQLTMGVGRVKMRIERYGANPREYLGIIQNAYSEYLKLTDRDGK